MTTLTTVRTTTGTPTSPTDEQLRWLGETLLDGLQRAQFADGAALDDDVVLTITPQRVPEDFHPIQYVVDPATLREAGHVLAALRQIRGGR